LWKAAQFGCPHIGDYPVMAIQVNHKAQWIPTHVVFPNLFCAISKSHRDFANGVADTEFQGLAIFVFYAAQGVDLTQTAPYLVKDALFAAATHMRSTGTTLAGKITIPTTKFPKRTEEWKDIIKVQSSNLKEWPVEIRDHVDIRNWYVESFLQELAGEYHWITVIVPAWVEPSDDAALVCAPRFLPGRMLAGKNMKSLRELWFEVENIWTERFVQEEEEERVEKERRRQREDGEEDGEEDPKMT
jgi:hypothetical protein